MAAALPRGLAAFAPLTASALPLPAALAAALPGALTRSALPAGLSGAFTAAALLAESLLLLAALLATTGFVLIGHLDASHGLGVVPNVPCSLMFLSPRWLSDVEQRPIPYPGA
ncbi:MAG TPA: hypothetical protein VM737_01350 [Gemmatimonadota bacterium]|nr:hypothetical protein [Gemmatimonadota bacterium]